MAGFPGGMASFMSGGPGVRVSFSSSGPGMSGGRAEEIFQQFFAGGDPFANMGFGDDDFFQRRGRGGGGRRVSAARERSDVLPRESVVKLMGLNNESLNGSVGLIEGYDDTKQRYNVRLTGRDESV